MRYRCWLQINSEKDINKLLFTNVFKYKNFWTYEIPENFPNNPVREIITFYKKHRKNLVENGIKNDDISVWINYEYSKECHLSFSNEELKELGELEIDLCFSCWKEGSVIDLAYSNSSNDEKIYYTLKIKTDKKLNILFSKIKFNYDNGWWYYKTEKVNNAIHKIISVIRRNQRKLGVDRISSENIRICFCYEYKGECSWEFSYREMKEMGSSGMDLFVKCYEIN